MMDRRFAALLGGPRTIGLLTFIICTPIGIVSTLTATDNAFASAHEISVLLATGIIGQVAMGAVLLIGHQSLRHIHWSPRATRIATLAVACCASSARGIVVALVPASAGLDTALVVGERFLSAATIFTLWLIVIGAALAANDSYRTELTALLDEVTNRELQLRMMDAEKSAVHRRRAAERIAESAVPIVNALDTVTSPRDYARTALLVQTAIVDSVRPLSHEFWFERHVIVPIPGRARDFVRRVLETPIPWRRALPLLTLILTVTGFLRWELMGAVAGLTGAATAAAIVLASDRLGRHYRLLWNALMYVALAIGPATVELGIIYQATGEPQAPFVRVFLSMGVPLALLIGAAANTLAANRQSTLRELRRRMDSPTWDADLGELHRRSIESEAGSFLHNTVQSRLAAGALQLGQAGLDDDEHAGDEALRQLRYAVDAISPNAFEPEPSLLSEECRRIALAWQGIAAVMTDVPQVLLPSSTVRVAVQVVDECVTNAVRHGRATEVRIVIRISEDRVQIDITDNGQGSEEGAASGVGTRWLDRAAPGRWSRKSTGSGTHVEVGLTMSTFPSASD